MTVQALQHTIETLTHSLLATVTAGQLDDIDARIDQRMQLITQLIALSPGHITPEALASFLKTILQLDEKIAQIATAQRDGLKQTLQNFSNVQEYLNV